MTRINIFGKTDCAKCNSTKRKLGHFLNQWKLDHKVDIVFHDMDTLDGRAEGAFHDVELIPATLVEHGGQILVRWDGVVPKSADVRTALETPTNATAH